MCCCACTVWALQEGSNLAFLVVLVFIHCVLLCDGCGPSFNMLRVAVSAVLALLSNAQCEPVAAAQRCVDCDKCVDCWTE
jgi:hypothetical protein